jgi:hypothetical protein
MFSKLIAYSYLLTMIGVFAILPKGVKLTIDETTICPDYEAARAVADETLEEFITEIEGNIGVGGEEISTTDVPPVFYEMQPQNFRLIGDHTTLIEPNKSQRINYRIFYAESQKTVDELNIRYFALLDEQYIDLDDEDTDQLYYDLTIHPDEFKEFSFELPPLSEGVHDLLLVGIPEYDRNVGWQNFFSYFSRISLVAGTPTYLPRDYTVLPAKGTNVMGFGAPRVHLNLSLDDTLKDWSYPEPALVIDRGTAVDFNLAAGHMSPSVLNQTQNNQFALLMLVDYQPFPIEGNDVLYAEVTPTTGYAQLPFHLETSTTQDRQDIFVIRIQNPGVLICEASNTKDESGNSLVLHEVFTMRASINIED